MKQQVELSSHSRESRKGRGKELGVREPEGSCWGWTQHQDFTSLSPRQLLSRRADSLWLSWTVSLSRFPKSEQ